MKNFSPLKIAKYSFWITFGIITFFYFGFILATRFNLFTFDALLFGVGITFIPATIVINVLMLIFLIVYGIYIKKYKETFFASGLILSNVIVVILYVLIVRYISKEPSQQLVFKNSIEEVTDSLNVVRSVAYDTEHTQKHCYIDFHDNLMINGIEIGKFGRIKKYPNEYANKIKKISSVDGQRFINLMAYLENNYFRGYYVDGIYGICVFEFEVNKWDYDDKYEIIFKDDLEAADRKFLEEYKYTNIWKYTQFRVIKDESKELVLLWYDSDRWWREVGSKQERKF